MERRSIGKTSHNSLTRSESLIFNRSRILIKIGTLRTSMFRQLPGVSSRACSLKAPECSAQHSLALPPARTQNEETVPFRHTTPALFLAATLSPLKGMWRILSRHHPAQQNLTAVIVTGPPHQRRPSPARTASPSCPPVCARTAKNGKETPHCLIISMSPLPIYRMMTLSSYRSWYACTHSSRMGPPIEQTSQSVVVYS